jgi:steroid delta-isomerase-like uncharacterized protein
MSVDENKSIVRRFVDEVWNQGNLAVIDELVAPNFVGHGHGSRKGTSSGPENTREFIEMCRSAFPDLHVAIEWQVAEGDLVATRWTLSGTQRGQFMGVQPTGKRVTVSGTIFDRIDSGKVAEEWIDWDRLGLMQQLGTVQR